VHLPYSEAQPADCKRDALSRDNGSNPANSRL
jgi:hypothetical protein